MQDAKLYSSSNMLPRRDARICLEEYSTKIKWKQNNRVLDIGSGDGSVTTILRQYIPNQYTLLGSDISQKMVDFAKYHHGNEQTSFTILDIEGDLPEQLKGYFNHVFSCYALHWVMNQERAFSNIYELMEEGGDCLVLFTADGFIFEAYRRMARKRKWAALLHDVDRYVCPYIDSQEPDKEIMTLMKNIGFVDIEVKCRDLSYIFDPETMRNILQALNPFKIPENLYDDYMADYYEVLKDMSILEKINDKYFPIIPFNYRLLVAYGSKPTK